MLRLIDLYHEEWDLLQETSLAMIKYKGKATRIKAVIAGVQDKISSGEKLTEGQISLVESSLKDWFSGQPEMVKLHGKWTAFSSKATKFNQEFTTSKIMDAVLLFSFVYIQSMNLRCKNCFYSCVFFLFFFVS